jgi:hypothetical protein
MDLHISVNPIPLLSIVVVFLYAKEIKEQQQFDIALD